MNLPTPAPNQAVPQHHKSWIEDEARCDVSADIELSSENIAVMFKDYAKELLKRYNTII